MNSKIGSEVTKLEKVITAKAGSIPNENRSDDSESDESEEVAED